MYDPSTPKLWTSPLFKMRYSRKNQDQTGKQCKPSVDPDEMAHYDPSHLGLHSLQKVSELLDWIK